MRPRALVSAFSCNPERGSEPGVGHYFVSELAKHYDLTVITEAVENQEAIIRRQQTDPVYARVHFHYLTWPKLKPNGQRLDDSNAFTYYRLLRCWEYKAFQLALELNKEHHFALAHHLTMQGYREPGFLWKLHTPFVWGPVGGHAWIPWRFLSILGPRGACQHGLRNVANYLQGIFAPRVRRAALKASAIVVNTSSERQAFRRLYNVDAEVIAEFGGESCRSIPGCRSTSQQLRLVWSGVHVARKALPILLAAAALVVPRVRLSLHILGDGPETLRWKRQATALGLDEYCVWHGRLPRDQALEVMAKSDVFVLTSLLDGTSCVLNEAISLGLPVICHRCCGFGDIVDETCGLLVTPESPSRSSQAFATAIRQLAADSAFYDRLAIGVWQRAATLAARSSAQRMVTVYERVLGRTRLEA